MSDTLARICADKRQHIARRKTEVPEAVLVQQVKNAPPVRDFMAALRAKTDRGNNALIAEIKKASPSKGVIRAGFDPIAIAKSYKEGGASCLSILTDEPYFQGKDQYLKDVRATTTLPTLRKDFILDPYQLWEARVLGADCILLIMAALEDSQAKELEAVAHMLGMQVLVEIHDEKEAERALALTTPLLGINNRNLKTLSVDLTVTERLRPYIPPSCLLVCESGIYTPADIQRMNAIGVYAFLVGESLMRQDDITLATQTLLA